MRQCVVCGAVALLAVVVGLTSCDSATQGPTAWLDRPLDGDKIALEPVTIQAHASDSDGIARFEFFIGDVPLATLPGDGRRFANAKAGWSPSAAGIYAVRARAVDSTGNVGSEAVSYVTVGDLATPSSVPVLTSEPTALVIPTHTPSPLALVAPTYTSSPPALSTLTHILPPAVPIPPTYTLLPPTLPATAQIAQPSATSPQEIVQTVDIRF